MNRQTRLRLVVALLVLGKCSGSGLWAQTNATPPRNMLGVELLGRGLLYSFNYERLLTRSVGVGGGVAAWSISDSGLFSPAQKSTTVVIPAYISWTPAGRTHSPYLAGGITVAPSKVRQIHLGNTFYNVNAFGTLTAGYQFRSRGGFVVRPTLNGLVFDGEPFLWPGILLGFAF